MSFQTPGWQQGPKRTHLDNVLIVVVFLFLLLILAAFAASVVWLWRVLL